jgi:hypothetical protein
MIIDKNQDKVFSASLNKEIFVWNLKQINNLHQLNV